MLQCCGLLHRDSARIEVRLRIVAAHVPTFQVLTLLHHGVFGLSGGRLNVESTVRECNALRSRLSPAEHSDRRSLGERGHMSHCLGAREGSRSARILARPYKKVRLALSLSGALHHTQCQVSTTYHSLPRTTTGAPTAAADTRLRRLDLWCSALLHVRRSPPSRAPRTLLT